MPAACEAIYANMPHPPELRHGGERAFYRRRLPTARPVLVRRWRNELDAFVAEAMGRKRDNEEPLWTAFLPLLVGEIRILKIADADEKAGRSAKRQSPPGCGRLAARPVPRRRANLEKRPEWALAILHLDLRPARPQGDKRNWATMVR